MPLDEDVVAAIYREHGTALRRFVLSASRDPQLADDIVQETVLRVWQQAPEDHGQHAQLPFPDGPEHHDRQLPEIPAQAAGGRWTATLADPAEATGRVDELLNRVLMEEALLRLSAEHRDVLVALHYRRFTVNEAAVQLNIPSGTVKSRAFYAVKALRTILDEMGVER